MSTFTRNLLATLAISLLCLIIHSSATQKTREQFEREFAENVTVPKILCHRQEPNYSEATCTVSKFQHSCNITLQSVNGTVGCVTRAVPFGKDRAIVLWFDRTTTDKFVKFQTLNLSSCEPGAEAKLAIGKEDSYLAWAVSVVAYDSSFDVFYVQPDRRQYCKQSMDAGSGRSIGEPVCLRNNDAPPFYTSYFPVEPYPSSEPRGYVLLLPSDERTIDAWFVGPEGNVVRFARFPRDLPLRRFAASTAHETITICIQRKLVGNATLVNCTRFDIFSGGRKQTTELKLVDGAKVSDVFNLPDGGYLLTLSKTRPSEGAPECNSSDEGRLMKISRENATFFAIDRAAVECRCAPAQSRTRMFENERREFCLTTVCSSSDEARTDKNSARTECFSDRELAVKTFTA